MTSPSPPHRLVRLAFAAGVVLLLAVRLPHLGETIDEPHAWRQCDTAQMIWTFHEEGIDLLHPSVCWLGRHRTLVLEAPLPEAVVALAYGAFGPRHLVARLVFLACFCAAAALLHAIVAREAGRPIARVATLFYLAMPLGQAYSRAIHIDFAVAALGHGALLLAAVALERGSGARFAAATLLATAAVVVKAPSCFFLLLPLLPSLRRREARELLSRWWPLAAIPPLALALWTWHAKRVNGLVPDLKPLMPDFHRMDDMWGWYFGTLAMRGNPANAKVLVDRLTHDIASPPGLLLLAAGVALWRGGGSTTFRLWSAGALGSTLVFFGLAVNHDYYQIPWMAPVAVLMAAGLLALVARLAPRSEWMRGWLVVGAIAPIALLDVRHAETTYYLTSPVREAAVRAIAAWTDPDDLVVVSDRDHDSRAPVYLYPARRLGWQVFLHQLTPQLLDRLRADGARWLAVVREEGAPLPAMLNPARAIRVVLPRGHELLLFRLFLDPAEAAAG